MGCSCCKQKGNFISGSGNIIYVVNLYVIGNQVQTSNMDIDLLKAEAIKILLRLPKKHFTYEDKTKKINIICKTDGKQSRNFHATSEGYSGLIGFCLKMIDEEQDFQNSQCQQNFRCLRKMRHRKDLKSSGIINDLGQQYPLNQHRNNVQDIPFENPSTMYQLKQRGRDETITKIENKKKGPDSIVKVA